MEIKKLHSCRECLPGEDCSYYHAWFLITNTFVVYTRNFSGKGFYAAGEPELSAEDLESNLKYRGHIGDKTGITGLLRVGEHLLRHVPGAQGYPLYVIP